MSKSLNNTTLYLRDLPKDVVRNLKAKAALRGTTLTALARDILSQAAGEDGQTAPGPLETDMNWYKRHKPALLRRYRGQYLAIFDRRVVDHDSDFNALARRVFGRALHRPIFMPKCVPGERTIHLRSPRLTRN
jgi:plasmid stability protein